MARSWTRRRFRSLKRALRARRGSDVTIAGMKRWIAVFAWGFFAFVSVGAAPQAKLPSGFTRTAVAERLTGATTLAVAPDGRVFVCEQTGALRVVKEDRLLERPFLEVKV